MQHCAFSRSTATALANRKTAINDRKYTPSRRSSTPLEISVKCAKKLSEAMKSTTALGAHPAKKLSTIGAPLAISTKHAAAVMTKAMTWFLVRAEMKPPRSQLKTGLRSDSLRISSRLPIALVR